MIRSTEVFQKQEKFEELSLSRENPRKLEVNDIEKIQRCLPEGLRSGGLYDEFLKAETDSITEPEATTHMFDKSVERLLDAWRRQPYAPDDLSTLPTTLSQVADLIKNTNKNLFLPISGAELGARGHFVHINTGFAFSKNREEISRRYYLNPRADKLGQIVDVLTKAALETKTPLYFKFFNIEHTDNTTNRQYGDDDRSDRIVIYASHGQIPLIENILNGLLKYHSEAFAGRKMAGFFEILSDGIAMADHLTAQQQERFKDMSFNMLRTKMITEATIEVTKTIITNTDFSGLKVDSKPILQHFIDNLTKNLSTLYSRPDLVINNDDLKLKTALSNNLNSEKLERSGLFTLNEVVSIEKAILQTAVQILPKIKPEDLLLGYREYIQLLSEKYGINPNNLAENMPLETTIKPTTRPFGYSRNFGPHPVEFV